LLSESAVLGITEQDTVWQGFSPAFDMWIEETWISFCQGAHLVVGTREECRDTGNLGALWKMRNISVIHAVPTLISIMAMEGSDDAGVPDNVRLVVSLVPALLRLVVNLIIFFPSEPRGGGMPHFAGPKAVASWAPHNKYLRSDGDNCIGYLGRAYAKQTSDDWPTFTFVSCATFARGH